MTTTSAIDMFDLITQMMAVLPSHRRAEAAQAVLNGLTYDEYEDLIDMNQWVDMETLDNLRYDVDYWQQRSRDAETTLARIAVLAQEAANVR